MQEIMKNDMKANYSERVVKLHEHVDSDGIALIYAQFDDNSVKIIRMTQGQEDEEFKLTSELMDDFARAWASFKRAQEAEKIAEEKRLKRVKTEAFRIAEENPSIKIEDRSEGRPDFFKWNVTEGETGWTSYTFAYDEDTLLEHVQSALDHLQQQRERTEKANKKAEALEKKIHALLKENPEITIIYQNPPAKAVCRFNIAPIEYQTRWTFSGNLIVLRELKNAIELLNNSFIAEAQSIADRYRGDDLATKLTIKEVPDADGFRSWIVISPDNDGIPVSTPRKLLEEVRQAEHNIKEFREKTGIHNA